MEENKEAITPSENTVSEHRQSIVDTMRKNPWVASTFVLGLFVLVLLITNFSGGISGNVISQDEAGKKLLSFYQSNGVEGLSLESVKDLGSIYQVNFLYQNNTIPLYMTKDGTLAGSLNPISQDNSSQTQEETPTEITKSDKPVVDLFIWSYCPYGVQAQGPLAEVAKLLKDKAEFNAILYYDGHGAFETQENKIQACIQKLAKDKYWDYAAGFVKTIYPKCSTSRDVACDKSESIKLMNSLGIDSTKIMACVDSDGESLIKAYAEKAQQSGVSGSPTLMINGVKVNSARTADAYKTSICSAFNTSPSQCSTTLNSTATASSGNC